MGGRTRLHWAHNHHLEGYNHNHTHCRCFGSHKRDNYQDNVALAHQTSICRHHSYSLPHISHRYSFYSKSHSFVDRIPLHNRFEKWSCWSTICNCFGIGRIHCDRSTAHNPTPHKDTQSHLTQQEWPNQPIEWWSVSFYVWR